MSPVYGVHPSERATLLALSICNATPSFKWLFKVELNLGILMNIAISLLVNSCGIVGHEWVSSALMFDVCSYSANVGKEKGSAED